MTELSHRHFGHNSPPLLHALLALAIWSMASQAMGGSIATRGVVTQYARLVESSYVDTFAAARRMDMLINAFLAKPSAAGLDQARDAWRAARLWYGQTEAYRFYGGITSRFFPVERCTPVQHDCLAAPRGNHGTQAEIDDRTLANVI